MIGQPNLKSRCSHLIEEDSQLLPEGISVVVPVYNSQEMLPTLVERLSGVLPQESDNFEIILVNDGSRDGSWQVIQDLVVAYAHVRGIGMMRNFGQHNALLCGIRAARFNMVVTMDDDLQHPPEEIPKLLKRLREGVDVVYGVPQAMRHSAWRNVTSWAAKQGFALATGFRVVKEMNAFRALRTDLRRAFEDFRAPNLLLDVLLSWGTTRFDSVAVRHQPRAAGKSNYTFPKLFNMFLLMLTGYSTAPLRLASLIGFAFTLFGLALLIYVLVRFAMGSVPGFTFLAASIAIFSGIQLFILGIIGEYLARIFNRSVDRPTYVVSQELKRNADLRK